MCIGYEAQMINFGLDLNMSGGGDGALAAAAWVIISLRQASQIWLTTFQTGFDILVMIKTVSWKIV